LAVFGRIVMPSQSPSVPLPFEHAWVPAHMAQTSHIGMSAMFGPHHFHCL
jgi:hypothetical protein